MASFCMIIQGQTIVGNCPSLENNVDYVGNDVSTLSANSTSICCTFCYVNSLCQSFTLYNGICYLKNLAGANRESSVGRISAILDRTGSVTTTSVTTGTTIAGNCPVQETNIDYKGNDIQVLTANSSVDCCTYCYINPSCQSYTYVTSTQYCWLKNANAANRISSTGKVSGVLSRTAIVNPVTPTTTIAPATAANTTVGCFVETDINYIGSDFFSTFVANSSECCTLCGNTDTCVVWSFLTNASFCYLKNQLPTITGRYNYTGMVSGAVVLR